MKKFGLNRINFLSMRRNFFTILLLLIGSQLLYGATLDGTIQNQATVSFSIEGSHKTLATNKVVTEMGTVPATLEFLTYAPKGGDQNITLSSTSYHDGSDSTAAWHTMTSPILYNGERLDISGSVTVRQGDIYASNDLLIVRVVDLGANQSIHEIDTIEVTLNNEGDSERILLQETAPNSGVFIGYIQLSSAQKRDHDGKLYTQPDDVIAGNYQSGDNQTTELQETAQITPKARVLLAESGRTVANVKVFLFDAVTQEVRYSTMSDENGYYSFPYIEPGNYILYSEYIVDPQIDEGETVGAAYVAGGYEAFSLNVSQNETEALRAIDIAFERKQISAWLEKQASKERVGMGEFIEYMIIVHNETKEPVNHLQIADYLPRDMKYQEGSLRVEGSSVEPIRSPDGLLLTVPLTYIKESSTQTVRYVAEVTTGIEGNQIINRAWLKDSTDKIYSNIATSVVQFEKELFTDHGVIAGRIVDLNETNATQGIRLYMENGAYVVTDYEGKYHFEAVEMGMHVLQLDKESLPEGYRVVPCEADTYKRGSDFSQFVEFKNGGLKRVDFCIENSGGVMKQHVQTEPVRQEAEKMPAYQASDIDAQTEPYTILWPKKGFIPPIPSTKLAIVHPKAERAVVYLNGSEVNPYNYDTTLSGKRSDKVLTIYKGIDLLEGDNLFEVVFFTKSGKQTHTLKRKIHVSGAPMHVKYHEDKSTLVADGRSTPVIAVQFFDADGYPLRNGIQGSYQIEAPYRSETSLEELQNNPLAMSTMNNRFSIEEEGIAYIRLQPTMQSGEVKLSFRMDNQEIKMIKAWLKPQPREWILVGFSQGTVGYETLKKHTESSDKSSHIYKDGRVAFFAKGKIKGEWILSMAYDSGKEVDEMALEEEIDPNRYYTLYGDSSEQYHDAASQKKLYLKLEKSNFYALFGDFQTGLTTTELSQYSRSMQGVKSEYHGQYVEGSLFVSKSEQMFQRDEIAGDGTSGFYYLSRQNVIMNSERIKIEVRDRYRNEIIIRQEELRRYQDYEIDYTLGRLYFKRPIYQNDENFNPQYIVAEYELDANAVESYTYGARVRVKPIETVALGSTYVNENMGETKRTLMGVDAEVELGARTRLRAEYAQTDTQEGNQTQKGSAKYLALEHTIGGVSLTSYFREQQGAFGLGQLSTQLEATRKIGVDVHKRFARWLIEGSFYRDEMLNLQRFNDVAEFNLGYDDSYWRSMLGYRYIKMSEGEGVDQITMMLSRSFFDHKLRLSVARDQTLSKQKSERFPNRTAVQANYNVTASVEVFGTHEILQGEETVTQTRAGVRVNPWQGATVERSQLSELNERGSKVYDLLGIQQQVQVNENIGVSVGYEQAQKVKSSFENEEFEAYHVGVSYNSKHLSGNARAEFREGSIERKKNLQGAIYTQAGEALGLGFGGRFIDSESADNKDREASSKLAMAYRPEMRKWMILTQLAYLNTLKKGSQVYIKTAKLISNIFLNYKPSEKTEYLFSYGLKHVLDSFDRAGREYTSYVDFIGMDFSYAIAERFDIGLQGAQLHSYRGRNREYSSGIYVGYNLFDNSWLRVGYNFTGFRDGDFSLQNYHRSGAYLQFNMKFDQESLKESAGSLVSW